MPGLEIRVATIGTWGHFGHVLTELMTMPAVRFVAHARSLPEDDVSHINRITRDETVPWFEDYRQMLRDVRPDVVIVSTRLDRINPVAMEAAEAGCHLICEKPLAIEHGRLARLYEVCVARKVQCIAMLGNGRHPTMLAASKLIAAGQVGELVLVNARKSYRWGTRPEWFGRKECYGESIGWIGIHALDMIAALTGQLFISVAAMESNKVHSDRPDCQDNGVLLVSLSGGGHASVSFDYLRPLAASTHGDTWIRAVGSRGVIEANLDHNWCRFIGENSPEQEIPLPAEGPYYTPFLEGLKHSNYIPAAEMRRAFMLTHACLCAADAARDKSVITIPAGPWD